MPKEIVNAVMKQIRAGKTPAFCKQRGLKGEKCAHAMAAVIENKIKKRKAAKGGQTEVELENSYGNYTQIPLEDEVIVEEDGVWLLAADKDTHLRLINGMSLPVDETAHMAALGAWVSPSYKIKAHLDHRPEKEVDIEVSDVRYDVDRGLYLKVRPKDKTLVEELASGRIRPSIETQAEVQNGVIDFYLPTGLGLMVEREPMGEDVGPENPPEEAIEALGGETVTEEQTTEKKNPEAEPTAPAEPPKKPEPVAAPVAEPPKKPEGEDYKQKYEELLVKFQEKEGMEAYVQELRSTYVQRLPEALRESTKDMSIDEVKRLVSLSEAIKAEFADKIKDIDTRVAPIIRERDEIKTAETKVSRMGSYTDEAWAEVKARESMLMGRAVPDKAKQILGEKGLNKVREEVEATRARPKV